MPPTVSVSDLFKKVLPRAEAAHQMFKDLPPDVGNARLPGGIENGVAQLKTAGFGVYKDGPNKDELFFRASGIVVSPVSHLGIKVAGLYTSIGPEPLCDTPTAMGKRKTFNDHYAWLLNHIKLLGAEEAVKNCKFTDLPDICNALVKQGLYFRFRTSTLPSRVDPRTGAESPGRVYEEWNGVIADYEAMDHAEGMSEDNTASPLPTKTTSAGTALPGKVNGATPAASFNEFDDLDSLIASASSGNIKAQQELSRLASVAGASAEEIEAAEDWAAVGALSQRSGSSETVTASVGDMVKYHPTDKNGRKSKSAIDCEVVAVNDNGSVDLKNKVNNKTVYADVPWSEVLAD